VVTGSGYSQLPRFSMFREPGILANAMRESI
jgi:hypothetical protein